MRDSLIRAVCKAAIAEESGRALSARRPKRAKELKAIRARAAAKGEAWSKKHIIDLRAIPVSRESFMAFDPNVRVTNGLYSIRYVPDDGTLKHPGRACGKPPFVIGQDLIRTAVDVEGWAHWLEVCDRIPELAWMRKWTTLTPGLFEIARKHVGVAFMFTINWEGYDRHVAKLAKRKGLRGVPGRPWRSFVTYKRDSGVNLVMGGRAKESELAPERNKSDVQAELASARKAAAGKGRKGPKPPERWASRGLPIAVAEGGDEAGGSGIAENALPRLCRIK